jgi:hypothetical protein
MNFAAMWTDAKAVLREIFFQFFPFPPAGSADEYAATQLKNPNAVLNASECADAIAKADPCVTKFLVEHARRMMASEDQRQASVMGRAQSLFFAIALVTSLTTVGASLITTSTPIDQFELVVIALMTFAILAEIVLLLRSLLHAIGGLRYKRAGSSDVTRWAGLPSMDGVNRNEALVTLEWYRDAFHKNTWRFQCLDRAMQALRNIVYLVCVLIVVFFVFGVMRPNAACTDETDFLKSGTLTYSVKCPVDRSAQHWIVKVF